jgi:hypothetical protein
MCLALSVATNIARTPVQPPIYEQEEKASADEAPAKNSNQVLGRTFGARLPILVPRQPERHDGKRWPSDVRAPLEDPRIDSARRAVLLPRRTIPRLLSASDPDDDPDLA